MARFFPITTTSSSSSAIRCGSPTACQLTDGQTLTSSGIRRARYRPWRADTVLGRPAAICSNARASTRPVQDRTCTRDPGSGSAQLAAQCHDGPASSQRASGSSRSGGATVLSIARS